MMISHILLCLLVLLIDSCYGHISISPSNFVAGDESLMRFNVPHGCLGEDSTAPSNTIQLVFQFPPDIYSFKPQVKTGWNFTTTITNTSTSGTSPYGTLTCTTITPCVWTSVTATAITNDSYIPNADYDNFHFNVAIPNQAGVHPYIAVLQYCDNGHYFWNQTTPDGDPEPGFDIVAMSEDDQIASLSNSVSSLSSQFLNTSSMLSNNITNNNNKYIQQITTLNNTIISLQHNMTQLLNMIQTLQNTINSMQNTPTPKPQVNYAQQQHSYMWGVTTALFGVVKQWM